MSDIYLYDDVPVLRNILGIKDNKVLDLVEAEQSRANMMLLYEQGFEDFSSRGLCSIHRFLFGDIYEWAGKYRIINIEKRERLLAGRSVWYSNDEDIERDLCTAFDQINEQQWSSLSREEFVSMLVRCFSTSGKCMSYFDSIYSDRSLPHRAKTVYMYLKGRSASKGVCWPGINTIAADLSLSRSTVKRALADLEKHGYLERESRFRDNGSHTSNLYRIK